MVKDVSREEIHQNRRETMLLDPKSTCLTFFLLKINRTINVYYYCVGKILRTNVVALSFLLN